jgi:hypothetical protein
MAERYSGAGFAGRPKITLTAGAGAVAGTTVLDGSQEINLVAGANITLTGTSPDTITIQSSGGGGGGGTIGGTISPTQVAYATALDTIAGKNDFTFDATSNVLSISNSGSMAINDMELTTKSQSTTGAGVANIDSWAFGSYRSVKYIIQVADTTAGEYQTSELLGTHDGTTGYVVEYGSIFSATPLGNFNGVISGANFVLQFTPATGNNHTVKVVRTLLS